MSEQVITRRSEHAGTRQKRTSCQLTEDGKTLKFGGYRFVLVARGQKTHRVGVPVGQEEAFFRAALKDCGWSEDEIKGAEMAVVGETIKNTLFDRRDTPYGANMAFDWRVDVSEVCNEQTGAGGTNNHLPQSMSFGGGNALNGLRQHIEAMRSRSTTPTTGGLLPAAKSKK